MRRPSQFTILGWILAIVMFAFLALIVVPKAQAQEKPRARLLLEIKDEKLRIFEYETPRVLCHFAIVDVKMIGSQGTLTCVKKDVKAYRSRKFIEIPLRPVD